MLVCIGVVSPVPPTPTCEAAFQRFHDALAENLSPEEILEIVRVVVNINVWTRIKLAERAMPGPA